VRFSRLIMFDKRGTGLSSSERRAGPLPQLLTAPRFTAGTGAAFNQNVVRLERVAAGGQSARYTSVSNVPKRSIAVRSTKGRSWERNTPDTRRARSTQK
jgi:hypothetical protein